MDRKTPAQRIRYSNRSMSITISQRGGGTKSGKDELMAAALFFINELFDSPQIKKLNIKVNLVFTPKGYYGWHEVKKGVHHITICRAMSLRDKISTLAHELVHAFQVEQKYFEVKNWCKYCNTGTVVWYGSIYKVDDDLPYNRQPWEVEAALMEKRIIKKYYSNHKKD